MDYQKYHLQTRMTRHVPRNTIDLEKEEISFPDTLSITITFKIMHIEMQLQYPGNKSFSFRRWMEIL